METVEYRIIAHGMRLDRTDFVTVWCSLADAQRKLALINNRVPCTIQKRTFTIETLEALPTAAASPDTYSAPPNLDYETISVKEIIRRNERYQGLQPAVPLQEGATVRYWPGTGQIMGHEGELDE